MTYSDGNTPHIWLWGMDRIPEENLRTGSHQTGNTILTTDYIVVTRSHENGSLKPLLTETGYVSSPDTRSSTSIWRTIKVMWV